SKIAGEHQQGGRAMSDGPEYAHEITSPGRPRTVEVADGVYAYVQPDGTWWINNTGFVVGPQGVFSIDACSTRSEEHTSELQSLRHLVCRLLLEKKQHHSSLDSQVHIPPARSRYHIPLSAC